jgi:hypothetical protein
MTSRAAAWRRQCSARASLPHGSGRLGPTPLTVASDEHRQSSQARSSRSHPWERNTLCPVALVPRARYRGAPKPIASRASAEPSVLVVGGMCALPRRTGSNPAAAALPLGSPAVLVGRVNRVAPGDWSLPWGLGLRERRLSLQGEPCSPFHHCAEVAVGASRSARRAPSGSPEGHRPAVAGRRVLAVVLPAAARERGGLGPARQRVEATVVVLPPPPGSGADSGRPVSGLKPP